ncbi:MAG: lipopolysaccharide biosynthesis protein [Planctomycetota bacterium]|nr:lipopolysaccharide biosynthesis protein [Planctomycetota bacterium]
MRKAVAQVGWVTIEKWYAKLAGAVGFGVLARLLDPEVFGVVAVTMLAVGLADMIASQGLGFAIIIRKEVSREELTAGFWSNVLLAFVLAFVVAVGAQIGAHLGGGRWWSQEIADLSVGGAISFLVSSFGRLHAAILTRELRFKALAVRSIVATTCGVATGICAAFMSAGPWSIILQYIVTSFVGTVMLWATSGWRPSGRVAWSVLLQLYVTGWKICLTKALAYARDNADVFVVSLGMPLRDVGVYAVARKVVEILSAMFTSVVGTVAFPRFARAQSDVPELWRQARRSLGLGALALVPVYCGAAALGEVVIRVVAGPGWDHVTPLMQILAIGACLMWVDPIVGAVATARQDLNFLLRIQTFGLIVSLAVVALATPFGLVGVAAAVGVRRLVYTVTLVRAVSRRLEGPPVSELLQPILAPLAAGLAMCAAVHWITGQPHSWIAGGAAGVVSGVLLYPVFHECFRRLAGGESLGGLWREYRLARPAGSSGA